MQHCRRFNRRARLNNWQLKERISAIIIELQDYGGAAPLDTYDALVENSPELLIGLPKQALIDLCEEIQRSEVPEMSERFQEMFREFNRKYFAGRLAEYEIRVVYDIEYWIGRPFHEGDTGIHQAELQRILIRIAASHPEMVSALLQLMAAAAGAIGHDRRRMIELWRLRKAGAPLGNLQLTEDQCLGRSPFESCPN